MFVQSILDIADRRSRRLAAARRTQANESRRTIALGRVQHAIDALPERTRLIFRRFRIDDIPPCTVAHTTGLSVRTVELHLVRAYEAIAAACIPTDPPDVGARHDV